MTDRCPYCNAEVEINHDDGYGYEEDHIFEEGCGACGKNFAYTTQIEVHHDPFQADCLNDGKHRFEKTKTFPPEFARLRCSVCGLEKPIPKEAPDA
jgi:hypothetical protein